MDCAIQDDCLTRQLSWRNVSLPRALQVEIVVTKGNITRFRGSVLADKYLPMSIFKEIRRARNSWGSILHACWPFRLNEINSKSAEPITKNFHNWFYTLAMCNIDYSFPDIKSIGWGRGGGGLEENQNTFELFIRDLWINRDRDDIVSRFLHLKLES